MSDVAIRVEGLGKQYRIGAPLPRYQTFQEALIRTASAPIHWMKGERQQQNTIWALDDVSFEIKHGEAFGIIGRNGAGKSTLLKILSRITRPTRGRVDLYGRVGSLLEVGTGFHPELTGRENIFLNGSILGMTRREINSKFDEIVDFAEIEKFLDTPVKRYSSGMYVRLAFAVAAHLEPEILLVDEVLAVGDAVFQRKCLGKMEDVTHAGRTVLFVSHNLSAISNLCSKSIWIDKGRIENLGKTIDVVGQYLIEGSIDSGNHQWIGGLSQPDVVEFKLLEVCIKNHLGEITSQVEIQKPFSIEITFDVFRDLLYARVGLVMQDSIGNIVFETYDADEAKYAGKREPGRYCSHCEIPADLLNAQRYFVSIHAGMPNIKYLAGADNVLAIDIQDTSDLGARLMDLRRDGIIRPKVKWEQRLI